MFKSLFVLLFFVLSTTGAFAQVCTFQSDSYEGLGQFSESVCEQTKASPECQELYQQMSGEGLLHKSLECADPKNYSRSFETSREFREGCAEGGWNFVESIGQAIGEGIAQTQIEMEEEVACGKDMKQKRAIFSEYNEAMPQILRLQSPADSILEGLTCSQIRARLLESREQKNMEVMKQVQRKREKNLTPEEQEFVAFRDNKRKIDVNLIERAKQYLKDQKIKVQCYNTRAAAALICEAAVDVGSLALGSTAVFKVARLARIRELAGLNRAAALTNTQRIQEAEKLLSRTLTDTQRKALIDAHEVAAGTGRGYTANAAGELVESTYTKTDLLQKSRLLRDAGFSVDEIDVLMRQGITGSFGDAVFATRSQANTLRLEAEKAARDGNVASSVTSYRKSAEKMETLMNDLKVGKSERDYWVASKINAGAENYDKAAGYYIRTQSANLKSNDRTTAIFEALNREKDELRVRAAKNPSSAGAKKDYEDHRKLIEALLKRPDFPTSDAVKRELLKP